MSTYNAETGEVEITINPNPHVWSKGSEYIDNLIVGVDPDDETTAGGFFDGDQNITVLGRSSGESGTTTAIDVPAGATAMFQTKTIAKATVPCPAVVVPTADDLRQIFLAIGNRYGWQELKQIEEILGAFPLSFTWNPDFDLKELEWDGRIEALIEEFKMFPAVKIAEVLSEFVPFDFEFTDPIFGIKVNVIKLFKDPEYKGELVKEMRDKFEELKDLLPDLSRENWDGTDGVDSPDIALSQMFKEMISEIKKMLCNSIHAAFTALIDKFKEIWDALGLEFIPTLVIDILTFDIDGFLKTVKDKWKKLKEDLNFTQSFKDYLLSIQLPLIGLTVGELINLDSDDMKIDFPNWDTQKIINKIKAYFTDFPQKLIEEWIGKVTKFFEEIGLKWPIPIPFTFCAFLEAIGVPKEINITNALTVDA